MIQPEEALTYLSKDNLLVFSILMYPQFKAAYHLKLLAKKLEAVERGEIKRLMVFMPPRHGKSMLCSQMFPAWYIGKHPDRQLITATYGHSLASKFGRDVRNLIAEPQYQEVFPSTTLAEDSKAKDRFNTNHKGVYLATGIGGAATGYGADLLLIDDPVKDRQDALSETVSENTWNWYTSVAHTRLMPNGAIILIMTRWSDKDLAGRILAQEAEKWDIVSLPAIENNEALWPEKYSVHDLEEIKKSIGPIEFSCLYQQQPIDLENAEFKKSWFRYYQDDECPGNLIIYTTVDPAISKKTSADESAIVTVGISPTNDKYILDITHGRFNPSELISEIFSHINKWSPILVGIETVAYQEALSHFMQVEMRRRNKFVKIEEIRSRTDKEQRIRGLIPHYANGTMWHRAGTYCTSLEEQLLRFPIGSHDDIIDALAMQLNFWNAPLHNKNVFNKPIVKTREQLMKEEQLFANG